MELLLMDYYYLKKRKKKIHGFVFKDIMTFFIF